MSNIRRQSIISSVVIYLGFTIGLLNIYLFTRQGLSANDHFTDAQFGLYNAFIAVATTMMAFANLAMPSYIYKFFPYYKDHLAPKKNDLITWALVVSSIGYSLVLVAGIRKSVFRRCDSCLFKIIFLWFCCRCGRLLQRI